MQSLEELLGEEKKKNTLNDLLTTQDRRLHCSKCEYVIELPGMIRIQLQDGKKAFLASFQCDACGSIKQFDKGSDEAKNAKCECGGTFSIDKPLFCPKCLHGK